MFEVSVGLLIFVGFVVEVCGLYNEGVCALFVHFDLCLLGFLEGCEFLANGGPGVEESFVVVPV